MNEHAGLACALSGLIVSLFAVLLHDRHPAASSPTPVSSKAITSAPEVVKVSEASASIQPPSSPGSPRPRRVEEAKVPTSKVVASRSTPPKKLPDRPRSEVVRPSMSHSALGASRSAFTMVGPGESLADLAVRVYGSAQATETIWKANRDQLERVDAPLVPGTLLRTP